MVSRVASLMPSVFHNTLKSIFGKKCVFTLYSILLNNFSFLYKISKNLSGYTFEQYSYKILITFCFCVSDVSDSEVVSFTPFESKNKLNVLLYSGKVFEISPRNSKITFLNSSEICFFADDMILFYIL